MPAGPVAKDQRMALERAHIGVLRGRAGAHAALAQIDLFEILPRRSRIEVEQRALRQGEADGALDVALHQFVAALEALIKRFQHPLGLLAGLARAFQRDLVAAGVGDDAEAPLDQREVLSVLPEQGRGEAIVVEGEGELRLVVRHDGERCGIGRDGINGTIRSHSGSCADQIRRMQGASASTWASSVDCASVPNRLLAATSVIVTAAIVPISARGASTCTGCR